MMQFFAELIDGRLQDWERQALFLLPVILLPLFLRRFVKDPKRPDPDSLEGVEFDENGAVKKEK